MYYLPRGRALVLSLSLSTEILKISEKSIMKHFSLSWLINQEQYCDRSISSRALHWLLWRALLETRCPTGEKKPQSPVPVSLRSDCANGACSAWAAGGFRAPFSTPAMQHRTQLPSPPQLLSHTTLNNYLLMTASCCWQIWAQSAIDLKEKDFPMFCWFAVTPCISLPTL